MFGFLRDQNIRTRKSDIGGGVGMYKNQLQELAQRSCFNLPSYACIREGPDHAPRFKASVNFNGKIFEAPSYCTTLRQAEHAAAEVALNTLSTRGPSRFLAARVLDETGVYKNLLQKTAHRAGEAGKTKKQAEKNAAMAAWSALKQMPNLDSSSQTNKDNENSEEHEQLIFARILLIYKPKNENRTLKQRDQNQERRRVVLSHADNNISSRSSCHKTFKYRQWRLMDVHSDLSSIYPTKTQNQNQNSSALLPPPTISEILPTSAKENKPSLDSANRAITVQVRNGSHENIHDIRLPLEEHQKDVEEWLNGKSNVTEEPIEKDANSGCFCKQGYQRPFPLTHYCSHQTQMRTSNLGSVSTPSAAASPIPIVLNTRRFHAQAQGIAQAVKIRTVIPVYAAPPARPPAPLSNPPPTPQMKEASQSQSHDKFLASVST